MMTDIQSKIMRQTKRKITYCQETKQSTESDSKITHGSWNYQMRTLTIIKMLKNLGEKVNNIDGKQ